VRVMEGIGAGEKSWLTAGSPKTTDTIVAESKTNETISHCQPATMRARRVR